MRPGMRTWSCLIGYSLFGQSQAAAIGGVVCIIATFDQEFAERRDPRLDPQRVLYLTLLFVAGFVTGRGLADRTGAGGRRWSAAVARGRRHHEDNQEAGKKRDGQVGQKRPR